MRQEFLAKLYFALNTSKENALVLIRNQKQECLEWLSKHEEKMQGVDSYFGELMGHYRTIQMQGMLEWLNIVEDKMG
jgi:hypothetical protein